MQRGDNEILTTHVGRLSHLDELAAMWGDDPRERPSGEEFETLLAKSVSEVVAHQKDCGVDVVSDGEFGKLAWIAYLAERLSGYEPANTPMPVAKVADTKDWRDFSGYYGEVFMPSFMAKRWAKAMTRSPLVCAGPVSYTGHEAVATDIKNLKAGMASAGVEYGFMNSTSPGSAFLDNQYYDSDEEYLFALADALHEEYKAITDAGLELQIDDPVLVDEWAKGAPDIDLKTFYEWAEVRVAALNRAVKGLPRDQIRVHVCWGSWHGPHTTDLPMKDTIPLLLDMDVGGWSVEAANSRHEHEFEAWRNIDLDGRVVYPGVVGHATDTVEADELVAWRIGLWVDAVGQGNVVASTDCGLGDRVHPQVETAKLRALSAGAKLASEKLGG